MVNIKVCQLQGFLELIQVTLDGARTMFVGSNSLKDFPEDMSESSTIDELVSEGDNMYDALKEAVELIHDLAVELEYKDAVEG